MTYSSARLGLPLLQAGQAQKEFTHNEALTAIEALVQPVAQTLGDTTPPTSPAIGACWIVGSSPSGAWVGQAGALAMWTDGGWRFTPPFEGMSVWIASASLWAHRAAGTWALGAERAASLSIGGQQVIGAQQPAIAIPGGGSTADTEARTAISAVILTLRAHGLIAT